MIRTALQMLALFSLMYSSPWLIVALAHWKG
jgi:hypothetical protein